MELKYEIIPENLKVLEIKQIFLDKDKLGVLTFDRSYPVIHSTRKMLVEMQELGYKEALTKSEVDEIDRDIKRLLDFITKVRAINPENDPSFNLNVRNTLENEIIHFCEDVQRRRRDSFVFLRQEVALSKPESKDLQEEKVQLSNIRNEYEKTLLNLKKEIEDLNLEKSKAESTKGEIASIRFGKYFESQAVEYESVSSEWLSKRNKVLQVLFWVLGCNFFLYLFLFFTWKLSWWPNFPPSEFFTTSYAVIKITGILLLSHVLAFNSKNYSITKNLSVNNKHRKNVADTINSFLESNPESDVRSQIIKQGTESMFKTENTGYLARMNEKGHSPIEQITYVMPNKVES